jgi:threonine/homoserine/homoserine lactone efflux protein
VVKPNTGVNVVRWVGAAVLAVIAATFSAVSLSVVGLLAGRARRWLSSIRTHRILEGVMVTVLVGLGIKVALDRP